MGDADPVDTAELASAYTPVPGGVGLLTIAMLMKNTVEAAERRMAAGGQPRAVKGDASEA